MPAERATGAKVDSIPEREVAVVSDTASPWLLMVLVPLVAAPMMASSKLSALGAANRYPGPSSIISMIVDVDVDVDDVLGSLNTECKSCVLRAVIEEKATYKDNPPPKIQFCVCDRLRSNQPEDHSRP